MSAFRDSFLDKSVEATNSAMSSLASTRQEQEDADTVGRWAGDRDSNTASVRTVFGVTDQAGEEDGAGTLTSGSEILVEAEYQEGLP